MVGQTQATEDGNTKSVLRWGHSFEDSEPVRPHVYLNNRNKNRRLRAHSMHDAGVGFDRYRFHLS